MAMAMAVMAVVVTVFHDAADPRHRPLEIPIEMAVEVIDEQAAAAAAEIDTDPETAVAEIEMVQETAAAEVVLEVEEEAEV